MKNFSNSTKPIYSKSKENNLKSYSKDIKPTNTTPNLSVEIENLKSLYYQLEFLNLKLSNTFSKQKILAEDMFYEKINEIIELRETNFNLFSQINGIKNISKIEEYLGTLYSKIHIIESKMANVLENIDDFKSNINFGLDRLYLEDNIVCDENDLIKNFEGGTMTLNDVIRVNQNKFDEIESLKKNYMQFIHLIEEKSEKIEKIKLLLENKKTEVLENTTEKIFHRINEENNALENSLFK